MFDKIKKKFKKIFSKLKSNNSENKSRIFNKDEFISIIGEDEYKIFKEKYSKLYIDEVKFFAFSNNLDELIEKTNSIKDLDSLMLDVNNPNINKSLIQTKNNYFYIEY